MTAMLVLDGAARRDAESTIRRHHYTGSAPSGKSHFVGHGDAIVVWSVPANPNLARFVLNDDGTVWELSRLCAPNDHAPNLLTAAIAKATSVLRQVEHVDAVVSYADPRVGHHGGVYRAASWRYHGQSAERRAYRDRQGTVVARRAFHSNRTHLTRAEIEALGHRQVKVARKIRFVRPPTRRAKRSIVWPADGPKALHDRWCAVCCEPMIDRRSHARYCSTRCRVAAHRARISAGTRAVMEDRP